MTTFNQFMRVTMHNFRMFWSASFGGGGAPLKIMTDEMRPAPGDEPPEGDQIAEVAQRAIEPVSNPTLPEETGPDIPLTDDGDDAGPIIQGALDLDETDGEPGPDIQVEVHGKRLGLTTVLESLLFVSDEPAEAAQLAKALDISTGVAEAGLRRLDTLLRNSGRGVRVQELEGRYQLVSAPESATAIEAFLNLDLTTKLSGPALEALAVIAYRQPVTRAQIEAVRGVDCAGVLRSLTQRGLVEEVGRLDSVGRPILYGVTDLFMQHFGLLQLGELPPLGLDEADILWAATELAEMEQSTE